MVPWSQDAAEASNVSPETRKFLQACRTDVDEARLRVCLFHTDKVILRISEYK